MVAATNKAKNQQKLEENDLAVIACSILASESISTSPNNQRPLARSPQTTNLKFKKNDRKQDDNEVSSENLVSRTMHDKFSDSNSISDHDLLDLDMVSYNFYNNSKEKNPESEAKLLFKPEPSSPKFTVKTSFQDLARNMDHDTFIVDSKSLSRPAVKEENVFSVCNNIDGAHGRIKISKQQATDPNLHETPILTVNSQNTRVINDRKNRHKSSNTVDLTADPIVSLISSETSSEVSAEWNQFYKELNLQPLGQGAVSDLDISNNVCDSVVNDSENSHNLEKNKDKVTDKLYISNKNKSSRKMDISNSGESEVAYLVKGSSSEEVDKILMDFHNFTVAGKDFLPFNSSDQGHMVNKGLSRKEDASSDYQSDLSDVTSIHSDCSLSSSTSQPRNQITPVKMSKEKNHGNSPHTLSLLTPDVSEFIPAALRYSNSSIKSQDSRFEPKPLQPLKPIQSVKYKNSKKRNQQKKQQHQNNVSPSSNHNEETSDPFGWGEINEALSSFKPKPQRTNKNGKITSSIVTTPTKSVAFPFKKSSIVVDQNKRNSRGIDQPNTSALSNSKLNVLKGNDQNMLEQSINTQPFTNNQPSVSNSNIQTHSVPAKFVLPKLPPSLSSMQPLTLPKQSPPQSKLSKSSQPASSTLKVKGPPVIPNSDSSRLTSCALPLFKNKVELVGMKTPRGMLRHYIQQKCPVLIILRGLPGSGKSHLAR